MAKKYDPNKDYSKAIEEAKASGASQATIRQLETERQAKIDDKYGGKEPTMYGSNKTYSQATKDNDSAAISNAVSIANNKNKGSSGSSSSANNPLTKGPGYVTGGYTSGGLYGTPVLGENQYWSGQGQADMSRRPDLAGGHAISNGYTVFYDENGYATKAVKGVVDYAPHQDFYVQNGTYSGGNLWTDEEMLTPEDLARIESIRAQISAGTLTGDQANALANQIRSGYGYTIDKNGNVTDLGAQSAVDAKRQQLGLTTNPTTDAQNTFLQAMFPEQNTTDSDALLGALNALHQGSYNPEIQYGGVNPEDLFTQIMGSQQGSIPGMGGSSDSFGSAYGGSEWDAVLEALAQQLIGMNYEDWTQGDQYAALANRYGNQGRMSMQDVLGQVSSRTGGLASSWAQTAANQQYNSFMSELENAAMEMYGVEQEELLDKANLARQYSQDDYNRWLKDRDFAYNAWRDNVADQQYADKLAYQRAQDQAEMMAAAGDFSGYGALGYSDEQIALLQAAYGAQNATPGMTDTPRKTGGSYNNGGLTTDQVKQLQTLLGVTPDGLWGNQSKKAADGMSADEAWAAYGDNVGTPDDYWLGDRSTAGGKTSLNWDQDEGIFTWNGQNYYDVEDLLNAIENANLTASEMETLKKKFGQYGFNLG